MGHLLELTRQKTSVERPADVGMSEDGRELAALGTQTHDAISPRKANLLDQPLDDLVNQQ